MRLYDLLVERIEELAETRKHTDPRTQHYDALIDEERKVRAQLAHTPEQQLAQMRWRIQRAAPQPPLSAA